MNEKEWGRIFTSVFLATATPSNEENNLWNNSMVFFWSSKRSIFNLIGSLFGYDFLEHVKFVLKIPLTFHAGSPKTKNFGLSIYINSVKFCFKIELASFNMSRIGYDESRNISYDDVYQTMRFYRTMF